MATKYISSLTGPEMDSALTDMAYHNSEAYAVGTRNGVPVGSSDVTYHNNSKYWAEQVYGYTDRAEDAANRAEAAVPSGTAGAVFFDRAQTLTSAEQAQARANIMAGGSNRNLLDNPWFTVRQRGDGPFTSGYTVDRWKVSGGTPTITPRSPYGINISASSAFAFDEFTGMDSAALLGKTVTLSALIGGVVYSGTGTYTSSTSINISVQAGGIYVRLVYDANHPQIRIYGAGTNNVDIDAVKLELGSVSTLANDAPPDYAEELLKCLRYQWIVDAESVYGVVGDATVTTQNTEAMMVVHYPVPMYKVPTLSVSGAFRTVGGNGSSIQIGSVTSMTVTSNSSNKNFARVTINGTNMGNTGTSVVVGANNSASAKLIFDANL